MSENNLAPYQEVPALSVGPFRATTRGLVVLGDETPKFELWQAYGEGLRRIKQGIDWILADWLAFGERAYGETYAQALDETDYELGTLQNAAWLARKVHIDVRNPNVDISKHYEVAPLAEPEQRRWLAWAEEHKATRTQLREAIQEAKQEEAVNGTEVLAPTGTTWRASLAVVVEGVVPNGEDTSWWFEEAMRGARFPFVEGAWPGLSPTVVDAECRGVGRAMEVEG